MSSGGSPRMKAPSGTPGGGRFIYNHYMPISGGDL